MQEEDIVREIERISESRSDLPEFLGPIPEERVAAAERELGLTLPRSYRIFLRHFGAAYMLGYQFHGLPDTRNTDEEMPDFLNVVDTTKSHWEEPHGMPKTLVYVTGDGGRYMYYLDTSKSTTEGECPVVAHGMGMNGRVVAEDFLGFLRKLSADGDVL